MRRALLQQFTWSLVNSGRAWRRAADEMVRSHDLSEALVLPLVFIDRLGGEPRQNALADAIGIEGPTLVRLLDQLCAAKLVVRQEDPSDRRAKILRLTEHGAAVVAALETEFAVLRDRVFAGISDDDIAASLRVFEALRVNTGGGRAARLAASRQDAPVPILQGQP